MILAVSRAFLTCFGNCLAVAGNVVAGCLTALSTGLGGPLRVFGKIATRGLATFSAGGGGSFRVIGKIAARSLPPLRPASDARCGSFAKLPPDTWPPFFPACDAFSRSLAKLPGFLFPVLAISFTSLVDVANLLTPNNLKVWRRQGFKHILKTATNGSCNPTLSLRRRVTTAFQRNDAQ